MIPDLEKPSINTAVVKIASRCNINCRYCYMYNKGDDSFLEQPKIMDRDTVIAIMKKVKVHCFIHSTFSFHFIFHGGEPMLAGLDFVVFFIEQAKKMLSPEITPTFSFQTNGTLIDDDWCDLLARYRVGIGISLDGTREVNDKERIDHKGRGTYDSVVRGIETVRQNERCKAQGISPGILSVIDVDSDPMVVYENFKSLKLRSISFLFPDNHYESLPKGYGTESKGEPKKTPYADWLLQIFQSWFYDTSPDKPGINIFRQIMDILLGNDYTYDYFGRGTINLVVIETNGDIEPADSLKICGNGFTKTGLNILRNTLDDVFQSDMIALYVFSKKLLAKKCLICPVNDICGGGFLPHRYSKINGFNNPSVYCADLVKLITGMQNIIMSEIPVDILDTYEVQKLTFEDAMDILEAESELDAEPEYALMLNPYIGNIQ